MKARSGALSFFVLIGLVGIPLSRLGESAQAQALSNHAPLPNAAAKTSTMLANSVSQYGITWHFKDNHQTGQFANGDYWVVGPVTITRITPDYDGAHNGWQINPLPGERQGFEKGGGEFFDPGLVPPLPYLAAPGSSIVKVISLDQNPNSAGDCFPLCLETAAVLTVVAAPPPGNGLAVFRPPYVGIKKPYYAVADLRTDLLPAFKAVPFTPALAVIERRFQRLQLDHIGSYAGRILRPRDNVLSLDPYQPALAKDIADGALRLMLDDPLSQKMTSLILYVQYGIDLHHAVLNGQTWPDGGGYEPGHKLPAAFAAIMLNDAGMKQTVSTTDFWNEDKAIVTGKNEVALFGYKPIANESDYWDYIRRDARVDFENPDPSVYNDGAKPPDEYQFCCMSMPWKTAALAVFLMPEMRPIWNSEPFFAYVDRWVSVGTWTQPDPCAPAKGVFGVDFGPDGKGDCIRDRDPSDGVGRFPDVHGRNKDSGFNESDFAREMWKAYRELVHTGFFIMPAELPRARQGKIYEYRLQAKNGREPYSWSLAGGALPNGIRLSVRGVIGGAPTTVGAFDFVVKVMDSDNRSATQKMSFLVLPDLPLSDGLVSYWPFDEDRQSVAADRVGANSGILMNGPVWRPQGGKLDGALEFDGIDDYVDIGNLDITSGTGVTFAFWCKARNVSSQDARFVAKATGVSDQEHYWMVSAYEGGALRFRLKTNGSTTTLISAANQIPANDWCHVAATYDGSSMRLFRNGVEIAKREVSGTITIDPDVNAAIGNQPLHAGSNPFDGLLDDMRVYHRALSSDEIKELHNLTSTGVNEAPSTATPPRAFYLGRNFPNPFNPSTTIPFYLPQASFVTLKISNLIGQQIAILIDAALPAGSHQVRWQADRLPSGLYFYSLKVKQSEQTQVMLLMN